MYTKLRQREVNLFDFHVVQDLKCYGCGQAFSERYRNAPNDLVLKRYDHRMYLSPRSKIPQHSAS
jgi:hypothetical protein